MSSPTILIADDNDDDILLLRRALQAAGIQNPLQVVRNGEEAIHYLSGDAEYADRAGFPFPILLILNLQMPRKTGGEVLAWLSTQTALPQLKLIVLTGSLDSRQTRQAVHLGAGNFLRKPPTPANLLELLRQMTEVRLVPVADGSELQWLDDSA